MRVTTAFNKMLTIPGATVTEVAFTPAGAVVRVRLLFVQTTISDPVERLGWGEEKDQEPSDVVRPRGGPADGHDSTFVNRGHPGQIERDRSSGSEAGDHLEQQISVLGQHRTGESQRAGTQEFELHLAIVGRSAT